MKRTASQPAPIDFNTILHSHLPCSNIVLHYCKYIHDYPNSSPLDFFCAGASGAVFESSKNVSDGAGSLAEDVENVMEVVSVVDSKIQAV